MEDILQLIRWDTVVTSLLLSSILWLIKSGEHKRDAAREETAQNRAEEKAWREQVDWLLKKQDASIDNMAEDIDEWSKWREEMERRLDAQGKKTDAMLKSQLTQMRSDITHKIHRYVDDLGAASTEEKNSLWAEYSDYCSICEQFGIENHFVEQMVDRAMKLPERTV